MKAPLGAFFFFYLYVLILLKFFWMGSKNVTQIRNVEVIGHRGNVSLYPENTLQGFKSLIALGADALELDLVISADKEVVVSHEAFIAANYMLKPDGHRVSKSRKKLLAFLDAL